jgi:uncharacterized protein with HEPN domain
MTDNAEAEVPALLQDIVFWGIRLLRHLGGVGEERFVADLLLCDACRWRMVCIGEAAGRVKQLRPELSDRHPKFELARAYAMRNRFAHGYDALDRGIARQAATISMPIFVQEAQRAIDGWAG